MGTRFQKRIKIAPGLSINLSKSGVSASVGTRGARMTFGHGKRRTTVGLPGSGISHTSIENINQANPDAHPSEESSGGAAVMLIVALVAIFAAAKALIYIFS